MKASVPELAGAGLIGAATGLRSQIGVAAVAVGARAARGPRPVAALTRRPVRIATVTAAVGELVADKLPATPSRLGAAGLVPRFVLGGATAAALAALPGADDPVRSATDAAWSGEGDASWLGDEEAGPQGRAHRSAVPVVLAAAVGSAAAVGAAFAGAWWRRRALVGGHPDWPYAVAEDLAAAGLAWAGCALAARSAGPLSYETDPFN